MSQVDSVVEGLKRALRARRITYADVAKTTGLSEASVKRMFSRKHFTLARFESICELAGTSLTELAREAHTASRSISQLTMEQEQELVRDPRLLLVALCALNQMTLAEIVRNYALSQAECIRLLVKLERIRFIDLLPGNQIKLQVSRTFAWLPDGPIQRYFTAHALQDFFRSRFDGTNELMLLVNGMLSARSAEAMLSRLKQVVNEFSQLHADDRRLPLGERRTSTLVMAMRPWELAALRSLRRAKR
jgi:DNA-binding Xre family transcriptional regulator